jgi:adenine-specific DNA-methyltransferase
MPVVQFKGKTAVECYHHTLPHHTLQLNNRLSSLRKDEEAGLEHNLIIEGDNLLALKALLPTHASRIKCIFLDPPYNTGNEQWIYNDNLSHPQFKEWIGQVVGKEGEDATRHDKWCCMMYPRLQLLKELLSDDGAIFVSIDDNESHHLRIMMDEIFGAENFLTAIVWKTRNTDNRVKTMLSVDHEYVLVYSMYRSPVRGRFIDRSDFSNPDNDPRGPYVTDPLTGKATAEERPNLHFVIENEDTGDKYEPDPARGWITDRAGIRNLVKEKRLWWPPYPQTGKPRKKRFLFETKERMPASSFWADLKGQSGADEVDQILGERLFAFPKSVEFMRAIIDVGMGPTDTILDATAGSGTTAHAVLAQNAADGGNRKFILIQMPYETKDNEREEFNICEKITAERVRRVIKGYKFVGAREEILLEENVTLSLLKKSDNLMDRVEAAKSANAAKFNEINVACNHGLLRVIGKKKFREKAEGLGGSFAYFRLGSPLLGEYRNLGECLPTYEELAKYIFYTETSRDFNCSLMNKTTHKIGEYNGTSYYLFYTPDERNDKRLDLPWLKSLDQIEKNHNVVVYCEKMWIHREDLRKYEMETKRTVRPMLVPFHLK